MATSKERTEILDLIEDDFRSDLAIHLYSIVLLKRINPSFPPSNWGNWPLPFNEVPMPRNSLSYADNIIDEDYFVNDVDIDERNRQDQKGLVQQEYESRRYTRIEDRHQDGNGSAIKSEQGEVTDIGLEDDKEEGGNQELAESASQDQEVNYFAHQISQQGIEEFISDDDSDSDNEIDFSLPIAKVTYSEKVVNAKSALVNCLNSIISKKITQRIQNMKFKGEISSNLDVSESIDTHKTVNDLSFKLAGKLNSLIGRLEDRLQENKRIITWQNVLLEGLQLEEKPHNVINTESYKQLYEKCEDLFENIRYKYELEDDEEEEEDDSFGEESMASEYSNVFTDKGGFDVIQYLEIIKDHESYSRNSIFDSLPQSYLSFRSNQAKINENSKRVFMEKLNIHNQLQTLDWSKKQKKSRERSTKLNILKEDFSNVSDIQQEAILHGSNSLDEDEYLLKNYV